MCQHDPKELETIVRQAVMGTGATVMTRQPAVRDGSRRRRLWELSDHVHCPVIGVCLPISSLRRIVDKVLGGVTVADDYELHCGVVTDSKVRTKLAEALQRELDRSFMLCVRQSAKAKSPEALLVWWTETAQVNMAGALWATVTHARCTPALEHLVLGQVHMIQHQVGAAQRVNVQRFEAVVEENAALARALGDAQRRNAVLTEEHARRQESLRSQIVQLRADLIGRDTAVATMKESLQALESAMPGLKTRHELARQGERQIERIHELERALALAQQEAQNQRRRAQALVEKLHHADEATAQAAGPSPDSDPSLETSLDDRAVLCVGGRQASVPAYRQLIEHAGGRFLHHDGGDEESAAKLDATLAAADLVICQTGCISHEAYWRVKNHCKRTGKRCVFLENPSASSLARRLAELSEVEGTSPQLSETPEAEPAR